MNGRTHRSKGEAVERMEFSRAGPRDSSARRGAEQKVVARKRKIASRSKGEKTQEKDLLQYEMEDVTNLDVRSGPIISGMVETFVAHSEEKEAGDDTKHDKEYANAGAR